MSSDNTITTPQHIGQLAEAARDSRATNAQPQRAGDQKLSQPRILPWLHQTNAAMSHDFCPWANRWVYWLKKPLYCLLLAIGLSLICGIFLSPAVLLLTAILAVITGMGVLLPWLAVRGIDVHMTFDIRRSRVGQPVLVRLRVCNRWPWPVWGLSLVKGFALREGSDTEEGVSLARVPGWTTIEYSWPFVPRVRGRYPLSEPEVESGFPFGMYRAARHATVDGHVIVWPKTVTLSGLPDAADLRSSDDQLADRRVGEFGDMLGTRLFREGDSLRRVHWAQTARMQTLIVSERQAPATSSVRVTVDLDPASHPQCDGQHRTAEDSIELAVRVAASICESLHRQHCRIELQLGRHLIAAGESIAGFQRIMDTLSAAAMEELTTSQRAASQMTAFGIAVTTPMGVRWRSRQLQNHHVISVADDSALQQSVETGFTWISLHGRIDVETTLPRLWKGACNAR